MEFYQFGPAFYQICDFLLLLRLSISLESLDCSTFSAKFEQRDSHGKSRNGHGKSHGTFFYDFSGRMLQMSSVHVD